MCLLHPGNPWRKQEDAGQGPIRPKGDVPAHYSDNSLNKQPFKVAERIPLDAPFLWQDSRLYSELNSPDFRSLLDSHQNACGCGAVMTNRKTHLPRSF